MRFLLLCAFLVSTATAAFCAPPFLTDYPEPVPFRHYEFYLFSTLDRGPDGYAVALPAFEFNVGAAPNLQLHLLAPVALSAPFQGPTAYGSGDVELRAKYRFVDEKGARPQVGIFPLLELPTGNAQQELGNGKLWVRLPVWVQKS